MGAWETLMFGLASFSSGAVVAIGAFWWGYEKGCAAGLQLRRLAERPTTPTDAGEGA